MPAADAGALLLVRRHAGNEALDMSLVTEQEPDMSADLESLETSFDLLAPRGDELMDEFYARLFAAAPAVRPLFPADMKKQKSMLLAALVLLRKSLRNLDAIVPTLRNLGGGMSPAARGRSTTPSSAQPSSRRWPRSQAMRGNPSTRPPGPRHSTSSPAR